MIKRALLIEDDPDIREVIAANIGDLGLQLETAPSGDEGLHRALNEDFAIVLVDLNLPVIGGMEICRQLRAKKPTQAIMILSSRSDELDKVSGLQLGADDYLVKPFSVRELLARIGALLRRVDAVQHVTTNLNTDVLNFDRLIINVASRVVTWDTIPIELTQTEFDILHFLAASPGRVFTRTQLVEEVLGYHGGGYDKTINSHLSRLRKKLETVAPNIEFFRASWGVGYSFCYGLSENSAS